MKNYSQYRKQTFDLLKRECQRSSCSRINPSFMKSGVVAGILPATVRIMMIVFIMLNATFLFAQEENDSAKAVIRLSVLDKDTVKQVTATVVKTNANGKETLVKGVEVHFYAERSYNPLPIGGDVQTTDETGSVTIDFPKDLPGDSAGNVTVIARIEADDNLGDLEAKKVVKWGIPVSNKTSNQRALWASGANAPIPLVLTVTGMLLLVWGVIFYVIAQLFRIKKLGTL